MVLSISVALYGPPASQCYGTTLSGENTEELRRAWVGSGEGSRAARCLDGQGSRRDR